MGKNMYEICLSDSHDVCVKYMSSHMLDYLKNKYQYSSIFICNITSTKY